MEFQEGLHGLQAISGDPKGLMGLQESFRGFTERFHGISKRFSQFQEVSEDFGSLQEVSDFTTLARRIKSFSSPKLPSRVIAPNQQLWVSAYI